MPLKYVHVDGTATLVQHRGPTTLPEAPPHTSTGEVVIAIHDVGGNGAVFSAVLDGLAEGHSPIAFDLPGHARAGGLDALDSIEAMAGFARALVDALGVRPPIWLGEGMGAAVALEAAVAAPDATRGLVLCSGGDALPVADADLDFLRRVTEGKARREFDRSGYSPKTGREAYGRAFAEWIKTDPRATYGDCRALGRWRAPAATATLSVPTRVVVGADEPSAPRAAAEALVERLPTAQLEVVPEAGRHLALEQPAAVVDAVRGLAETLAAEDARA